MRTVTLDAAKRSIEEHPPVNERFANGTPKLWQTSSVLLFGSGGTVTNVVLPFSVVAWFMGVV
jgi:hypothetical protein